MAKVSVRSSLLVALVVAVVALAGDLVVKAVAWDHFVSFEMWVDGRVVLDPRPMSHVEALPGLLDLTAVANQGAAMGLGQGKRPLFLVVGVVACIALAFFFWHSVRTDKRSGGPVLWQSRLYRFTLAMLLAGVVG
ncbi:MAG: signal peptidase II, partial [Planctomycetota bacterium]